MKTLPWLSVVAYAALTSCKTKPAKAPEDRPAAPTGDPVVEAPEEPADLCGSVMEIVDAGDRDYDFAGVHGSDLGDWMYKSSVLLPGAESCTLVIDEVEEYGGVTCEMALGDDQAALEAQRLELIDALTPCFSPDVWRSAEHSPTSWSFVPLDGQPTYVQVKLGEWIEELRLSVEFDNHPEGPE